MRTRLARSGASSSMMSRVAMSGGQRDGDFEAGASPRFAVEADGAAMQVERLLHDRESQSRARDVADVARAMERLEQPRLVLRGDADAAVPDLERGGAVVDPDAESYPAAPGGVLESVGYEVHQHMAQQPLVHLDGAARAFVAVVEGMVDAGDEPHLVDEPVTERAEVGQRRLEFKHLRFGAADDEHVVEHPRHAIHAGADALVELLLVL